MQIWFKRLSSSFLFIAAFALGAPLSHASNASERLSVVLSKPDSAKDADTGIVVVTITNKSSEPLFLPKIRTPLSYSDGHIMGHFMDVKSDEGAQAKFIGMFSHILPITMDFYIRIEPGQSLSQAINLSVDYDLSEGGHFQVSYEQPFDDNVHFDKYGEVTGHSDTATSNVLDIWVSASLATASKKFALGPKAMLDTPDVPELSCDSKQMLPIFSAKMTMANWLSKAEIYTTNLWDVEEVQVPIDNDETVTQFRPRMKPDFKYQYWFGALDNDPQMYTSRPGYRNVWDKDDFYPFKQLNAITLRSVSPDFHYSCGCPGSDPTVAGKAETGQPYLIHICDIFFSLDKGQQVQTLVHELSHFGDEYADWAFDYVYGRDKSHALATSNRKKALRNADTIGFFVQDVGENTP